MEQDWASEHLQVIRTLMERSALYRRALAPIMTFSGILGTAAGIIGSFAHMENSTRAFVSFWVVVSFVVLVGTFFLVRRQALKDREPLWSPPTRRVSQALLPCLFVGALAGLIFWEDDAWPVAPLAPIWIILYGCALHAAGFFMTRGIKLFGWSFIAGGFVSLFLLGFGISANWLMGFFFGVLHLAYGIYLYFTEKRRSAA